MLATAPVANAWPFDETGIDDVGQQCWWRSHEVCRAMSVPTWEQEEILIYIAPPDPVDEWSWTYICLPTDLAFGSWEADGNGPIHDGHWDTRISYYEPGYTGGNGRVTGGGGSSHGISTMASVAFAEVSADSTLMVYDEAPWPVRLTTDPREWHCGNDYPFAVPTELDPGATSRVFVLQYIPDSKY